MQVKLNLYTADEFRLYADFVEHLQAHRDERRTDCPEPEIGRAVYTELATASDARLAKETAEAETKAETEPYVVEIAVIESAPAITVVAAEVTEQALYEAFRTFAQANGVPKATEVLGEIGGGARLSQLSAPQRGALMARIAA